MNRKLSYLLIAVGLVIALVIPVAAQLGIGTNHPDPSAALDIVSTTQGVLHPRLTTTQRNAISSPAEGLTIYNTTDKCLQVWDGVAWKCAVGSSSSSGGNSSSTLGANTSIPNVFVSDALRRIFGAWNNTTKDWQQTSYHDQFWIDDNTFGITYGATTSTGLDVPFIKLYDANFSFIREFAVTTLADPNMPYGSVAAGLNNGNIVIYQEGAGSCYCGYWAIVDQQGNTVVGKQTVQNTINTDSAVRLNLITLSNGNFVLSTRYSASALRSYVISQAGAVLKTIDHPFNYAQSWMRFRTLPTDFGFAVIYESQWTITYKYAAYDFAGNTLVAATPVTTNTSSAFYNTHYNTGIDAAVGDNKQIFLVSMPNSYPGSTSLMKLVYDNTGMFTSTYETSVGTIGQAGWGGNELHSWNEKQSAKGSQLAYLGYPDQGIAGSGPFATFADGTPRVDRLAGMKLNIYNFSSNTLTKPFQISLSPALRASGAFASNSRLYNDGIGNGANHILHFSPSGHRLFFGTLMADWNLSAILFDTSDMNNIIPVTFKMRADNTPQDFGKRFFVWDVSDNIKKVEVTVTGGSNNTMSCVCSSTDLTGVPFGGTLIIQATGAGAKNITFTDALNSAYLATDTPGERTITVKATNAANVVSKVAIYYCG